jgi:hypothetical protein
MRERVWDMGETDEKDHTTQDTVQGKQVALLFILPEKQHKHKQALSSSTEE